MFFNDVMVYLENTLINWQVITPNSAIQQWLIYFVLFALAIVEGPIATLTAAAISATGRMNPYLAFVFAASGNMTADFCYYLIGKLGKFEMVSWVLQKVHVNQQRIEKIKDDIVNNSAKTIFIAKLTNSLIIPMLIMTGTIRIPVKRWMPALIFGEILWSGFLMVAGYYFSHSIRQIESGSKYIGIAISIIVLLIVIFWMRKSFRQQQEKNY
jgi:membrane protein DedA with SNARE-associated domain